MVLSLPKAHSCQDRLQLPKGRGKCTLIVYGIEINKPVLARKVVVNYLQKKTSKL